MKEIIRKGFGAAMLLVMTLGHFFAEKFGTFRIYVYLCRQKKSISINGLNLQNYESSEI